MTGKIIWSSSAKKSFDNLVSFLESKWKKKVIEKLFSELDNALKSIAKNPEMYPAISSNKKEVRKCIIRKKTLLLYRIKSKNVIELAIFADTRQNPKKYKI